MNVSRIVELPGDLYYNGTGTLMGCTVDRKILLLKFFRQ